MSQASFPSGTASQHSEPQSVVVFKQVLPVEMRELAVQLESRANEESDKDSAKKLCKFLSKLHSNVVDRSRAPTSSSRLDESFYQYGVRGLEADTQRLLRRSSSLRGALQTLSTKFGPLDISSSSSEEEDDLPIWEDLGARGGEHMKRWVPYLKGFAKRHGWTSDTPLNELWDFLCRLLDQGPTRGSNSDNDEADEEVMMCLAEMDREYKCLEPQQVLQLLKDEFM